MPRYKPRVQAGPELSRDSFDKMIVAMTWWQARHKSDSEYIGAPHFYDAILAWHDALSLDNEELCGTVQEVYNRPGWGPKIAEQYAADLPPVPLPPAHIRQSWLPGDG